MGRQGIQREHPHWGGRDGVQLSPVSLDVVSVRHGLPLSASGRTRRRSAHGIRNVAKRARKVAARRPRRAPNPGCSRSSWPAVANRSRVDRTSTYIDVHGASSVARAKRDPRQASRAVGTTEVELSLPFRGTARARKVSLPRSAGLRLGNEVADRHPQHDALAVWILRAALCPRSRCRPPTRPNASSSQQQFATASAWCVPSLRCPGPSRG